MSITKNFLYNSAITVSTYIIGFIIFPYITRVLGVSNIGVIGYVDNVISYFVFFMMLGAHSVGVREIAACQGDKTKCTDVFFSILSFLFLSTLIASVVYTIVLLSIPQFAQYKTFFIIGYVKLLFTPFVVEWLFAGSQDFSYISKRTITIRVLYALSIFIFIKKEDDIWLYFMLTGLMTVANSIINLRYARKYIDYKGFVFTPKSFFRPIIKLGVFQIIISFYSTFNYIYLRWVSTEAEVGLYYTSIKIYSVIVGLFSAYTNVVMPRMSELLEQKKSKEAKDLINKSFGALFSFCVPVIIITIIMTPIIIKIIAGNGYEGAIAPMVIVMPVLLIAGLNQINGTQLLMPLHKDNILLITASIAAFVGLVCNVLLDEEYGSRGAALTVLFSELTGCIGGYLYSIRNNIISFPLQSLLYNILVSLPYILIYVIMKEFVKSEIVMYVILAIAFSSYFVYSQYAVIRNPVIIKVVKRFIG